MAHATPIRAGLSPGRPVALALLILTIGGCRAESDTSAADASRTTRVVCSITPIYLFAQNIIGNAPNVELSLLLPAPPGCPHDVDLSMADARRLHDADVVLLNGGLEAFAGDAIRRINPKARQIETAHGCGPGFRAGLSPARPIADDRHDHEHHHHSHDAANPHVWLTPAGAICQVRHIADGLADALPAHAEDFRRNASAYVARLEELEQESVKSAKTLAGKRVVVTHDIFDLLAHELGLELVAALYPAPPAEPTPAHLTRVVAAIRERQAAALLAEPRFGRTLAERIAQEAGVPLLVLDPLLECPDSPPSDYYERVMRENLERLVRTLQ
jgi:zinc transport system substrate-binding protein